MALSRIVTLILIVVSSALQAQDRYMVFFTDKNSSPYSVSQPEAFLSARSLARRSVQSIVVTEQDIPVNTTYLSDVEQAGAEVYYATRWMNGALISASQDEVDAISALPFVADVEYVAPGDRQPGNGRIRSSGRKNDSGTSTLTFQQLTMLGLGEMHQAGYTGEGMSIAIFDAGFDGVNSASAFQHLFDEGRISTDVSYDYVHGSSNVFTGDSHGTGVFSVMAGYVADAFIGGAYGATYQLFITEDPSSEFRVEEYNWLFAAERADSAGVDIINSSLGYNLFDDPSMNYSKDEMNGETAVISIAAQYAAQRGMLVVTSAGNEGNNSWQIVTAPADSEWVLSVASVNNAGIRSNSSSTGPDAEGNIKPDVAAMGVNVSIVRPNGSFTVSSGTSFASPLIASLVAGVWQRYPSLNNFQIMEMIKSSASQAANPDFLLGYGIPNFKAIVNKLEWDDQEELVRIFPNPVTDTLNIRPSSPTDVPECTVEFVTLQGQILDTQTITVDWLTRNYQADCSRLAAGMYLLRVLIGDEIFSYKIVKL